MRPIIDTTNIAENDRIVIAVSGGIDSMVLFANLRKIRAKYHLSLVVCHVDHQVRAASKAEYQFVESVCAKHDIPFYGMRLIRSEPGNFHDDARTQRYRFFAEIAKQTQSSKIAIAHQADDQTETILMRLVRGSSFVGYAGMEDLTEYQGIQVIRPMLQVTRKTIERYQKAENVDYIEDESNKSSHYTRNRFRHDVLPLLLKENPQLHREIGRYALRISEASRLISRLSEVFLKENVVNSQGVLVFSRKIFQGQDDAVKREVLKRLYDKTQNNQSELAFPAEQTMLKIIDSDKPHQTVVLPHGIALNTSYDSVTLGLESSAQRAFSILIDKPGSYELPNGDFIFITNNESQRDGFTLELWYNDSDIIWPLTIRTKQPGDRIRLAFGSKKVNDLLIDRKIPKANRESLVVLTDHTGEVLWIPGIRIASSTRQGEHCLSICYRKG